MIASGGVGDLADLEALAREAPPNVEGVIVGRALYERRFTVAEGIAPSRPQLSAPLLLCCNNEAKRTRSRLFGWF